MNLRQLQYYVRVFEMQNITRAAETLHIAQPALSQQLSILEESLGVRLLIRKSKGVAATPEGHLLYQHAQTILRQVDATRSLLSKPDTQTSGIVSIGMPSSTTRILALPLIKLIKKKFGAIVLDIVDAPSVDLVKLLLQGRIDFALSPDQTHIKGISSTPLFKEDLLLLVNNAITLPDGEVTVETAANIPLILPSLPNQLRLRVEHAFHDAKLSYNLFAEAGNSTILIQAVQDGLAAAILPYSAAHPEITSGLITSRPLEFMSAREFELCHNETLPLSPAAILVIDLCKALIKQLVARNNWLSCHL